MKTHFDDPEISAHVSRVMNNKLQRFTYLETLSPAIRMAVFNDLSPAVQRDILDRSPASILVPLIDHFDHDRAQVYLRQIADSKRRKHITTMLRKELKQKVEQFTSFHTKVAHELVKFNYILLPHTTTIGEAADAIALHRAETGHSPEVLVRRDGICIGEIDPRSLILNDNTTPVGQHISAIHTLPHTATATDIARIAMNSAIQKIVVTDAADKSVIGIVYTSEVIDLFDEKPEESLYNFVGLEENEHPFDSALSKIRTRTKWLVINLITAFLAASVVVLFHGTLAAVAALAIFMPIVAGMGSNAGMQTFAVFIRGLTLGEITLSNMSPALRSEIIAVFAQGVLQLGIITLVTVLLGQSATVGIIAGIAVAFSMFVGVVAGSLIPVTLHKLGKDPALSSGIILTTFTEVAGLVALFGLAYIFLL